MDINGIYPLVMTNIAIVVIFPLYKNGDFP